MRGKGCGFCANMYRRMASRLLDSAGPVWTTGLTFWVWEVIPGCWDISTREIYGHFLLDFRIVTLTQGCLCLTTLWESSALEYVVCDWGYLHTGAPDILLDQLRSHTANSSPLAQRLLEFDLTGNEGPGDMCHVMSRPRAWYPTATNYVALSHCWGRAPILRLTKDTVRRLSAGMRIRELPRTFRDAVCVCRWLGYRRLWIDSLCILQDSASDWEREAQTMKDVYGNAVLTIVAARAKDSSEGLFTERDPAAILPPVFDCVWSSTPRRYYAVDQRIWLQYIIAADSSPLASRGWTVQERVLAPRTLYFAENMVFYHCSDMQRSEAFPAGDQPDQFRLVLPKVRSVRSPPMAIWRNWARHSRVTEDQAVWMAIWRSVVEAYSKSYLTKDSDMMVALSGIAQAVAEGLGDTYLAGLWRNNVVNELLWEASQDQRPRPNPCLAPTWSWLSTRGQSGITAATGRRLRQTLVEIVEIDVELADAKYPTRNINFALLQLRGVLKPAEWALDRHRGSRDFRRYQVSFDGIGTDVETTTLLDVPGDEQLCRLKLFLLPVGVADFDVAILHGMARIGWAHRTGEFRRTVECLLLTPRDEDGEMYERIGKFNIDEWHAGKLFEERSPEPPEHPARAEAVAPGHSTADFVERGWKRLPMKDIVIL